MSLLDGAYARLDRIEAKHTEFRERGDEWVNSSDGKAFGDRYLEQRANVPLRKRKEILAEVPPILSIVAGEAIYNIRSALDYLAHELVFLSKRVYYDRSQFPIDDDRTKIPRSSSETLKQLRPCDREIIETLQPYNGCEWTGRLRDLSNPDKHRKLMAFAVDAKVVLRLIPPVTGTKLKVLASDRYVERGLNFTIGFDASSPVAQTLDLLKSKVADVLDSFKPEFEAEGL